MKAETQRAFEEAKQMLGQVPDWLKQLPECTVTGFWSLMRDFQLTETSIPNKYKELIGLAVAGATRCKYCTYFHTQAARLFGATDEEIAEAGAMGGLTMMASTFLNAEQVDHETFTRQVDEMADYIRQHPPQRGEAAEAAAHA
jgi:AhpD family alkylhydroperoxidase